MAYRIPKNAAQRNAADYRHGQIEVLVAAKTPLEEILDRALFEHSFCTHNELQRNMSERQLTAPETGFELVRLDCAYHLLQKSWGSKFESIARAIESELELERFPGWDWENPDLTEEWGFTLWVLFIYLITMAHQTNMSSRSVGVMHCLEKWVQDGIRLVLYFCAFS